VPADRPIDGNILIEELKAGEDDGRNRQVFINLGGIKGIEALDPAKKQLAVISLAIAVGREFVALEAVVEVEILEFLLDGIEAG
jgi:hypothetical protein